MVEEKTHHLHTGVAGDAHDGGLNRAPGDGNRIEISFEDESGKIPMMHATTNILVTLFQDWNLNPTDAQHLADVLLSWIQQTYVPTTGVTYSPVGGSYNAGDSVTVTATAASGYEFAAVLPAHWTRVSDTSATYVVTFDMSFSSV